MRICRNCNFLTKDDKTLKCPDCGEKTQEMSDEELYFYRQNLETQADLALRAAMYRNDRRNEIKRTPFSWACTIILILSTLSFTISVFATNTIADGVFPVCLVIIVNVCCLWPLISPASFAERLTTDREIDQLFMNRIFVIAFSAAIIIDLILISVWLGSTFINT